MPRVKRLSALLLCALCVACQSLLTTPPAACAKLIPVSWGAGVEAYPIPAGDALDDWRKAFVGQSGQLSKANGRTADAISIMSGCEKLVNEARP